jgi:hypothetical protein
MPNLYHLVLFAHVSGDIGIFVSLGIQLVSMAVLRRAQTIEQARVLVRLIHLSDSLSVISVLLTLATGLYMALTVWNLQIGWIAVSLASLILLMPPLIQALVEPRMRMIMKMVKEAPDGPLPEPLYKRLHDPVLSIGLHTTTALVFGIVFLMTTKPALVGSIVVIAFALILGIVSGLPIRRQSR